jgi:hypothetical protein
MALFRSQEEKTQEFIDRYGLTGLTNEADQASVYKIATELVGTGLMETGMTLSAFGKSSEALLPVYYQRAILEQNWIIIRQLDRISAALEELAKK